MKKYEGNRNMQVAQPCSDPLSSYKASYLGPTIPFIHKNLVDQFRLHFELTTECSTSYYSAINYAKMCLLK